MSSVYPINKGINKPIEFHGLKAQYIGYLAGGLVGLLLLFAVLYICGVGTLLLVPLVLGLGTLLFSTVYRLSKKYGQHGLMKLRAKRGLPVSLQFRSRRPFLNLIKRGL